MSDPRFARLKSDPRFRRIRKKEAKVVVDDRFKGVFGNDEGKKKKDKKGKGRVDRYGRKVADTQEQDDLRRFYRLDEEEEGDQEGEPSTKVVDYARGQVLMESSDEEGNNEGSDDESDTGGVVTLGADVSKPIHILGDDEEAEVDLDEDNFADLDAQAAEYSQAHEEEDGDTTDANHTRRLAVVNLDWEHVRAIHLYKIFSSLVSPTASALPSSSSTAPTKNDKKGKSSVSRVVRGKVLSVRVYPSEFGKERLAREEKEGPPPEVFSKTRGDEDEDEDLALHQTNDGKDYNEEALRKYQLERLRYYYAIVECDSVATASHLYTELEGTELERSANVFDLSFVPDDMTFDDEFRDEATADVNTSYKPVEFVTDALRHSRVKLTWDEDDPERVKMTRRAFTRKEIEENDFKAYIASSSDSESEEEDTNRKNKADREKLRALLLGGGDDTLPEGWGKGLDDDDADDVDMEVTFAPGLSETKDSEDETTLEKYQRKMREKKHKRKEELKEKHAAKEKGENEANKAGLDDDFFAGDSDSDDGHEAEAEAETANDEPAAVAPKKNKKGKGSKHRSPSPKPQSKAHEKATAEELALLAASDNPNGEPKHFDMKAVIKAEKAKGKKRKGKKGKQAAEEANELQEDFAIDVKDERFKAVLEDHTFAIDPSNPHFKKTKNMSALLDERSKRQKTKSSRKESTSASRPAKTESKTDLKSLVESVKRKSAAADERGMGKRRKT